MRINYCYQIGTAFVSLSLMEDTIINAMLICDRIKVTSLLGSDTACWDRMMDKKTTLEDSTLGSLIAILSRHSIEARDLAYLKWVKAKRDFFIHRFFRRGCWPGDMTTDDCALLCRTLLFLEIIFARASHRIWQIFPRAKLMAYHELGEHGALMYNYDMLGEHSGNNSV